MLKYILKFTMDILPSLTATVIGAYIVNHYIVAKPGADAPVAAVVSKVEPNKAEPNKAEPNKVDVKSDPKPSAEAPTQNSADKPAETASIPLDPGRPPSVLREKAVAKSKTVVATAPPAVAPVVALPAAPPTALAAAPKGHRDADEVVRAAVERLRSAGENSPRAAETTRVSDAPRIAGASPAPIVVPAPVLRPLPPPIMVSTPLAEQPSGSAPGSAQAEPIYPDAAGLDDPSRPTPPADIPPPPPLPPLVLRADAGGPSMREHPSVAEDMLAAARSVLHAVLPNHQLAPK